MENKTDLLNDNIPHCCEFYCKNKATFHIQEQGTDKNQYDYLHSCDEHLLDMIADSTTYTVWRLDHQKH